MIQYFKFSKSVSSTKSNCMWEDDDKSQSLIYNLGQPASWIWSWIGVFLFQPCMQELNALNLESWIWIWIWLARFQPMCPIRIYCTSLHIMSRQQYLIAWLLTLLWYPQSQRQCGIGSCWLVDVDFNFQLSKVIYSKHGTAPTVPQFVCGVLMVCFKSSLRWCFQHCRKCA